MKNNTLLPALTLLILLLSASCNHLSDHHVGKESQTVPAPDSLWTPTGDALRDSLLRLSVTAPPDTNLALLYRQIGRTYANNDFEKAKEYYIKSDNLSRELNWSLGHYLFASDYALILYRQGLADSALAVSQKALDMAKREGNESRAAVFLFDMGNAYIVKGWNETALNCYMEVLYYSERENKTNWLLQAYAAMVRIYNTLGSSEKAIEYGQKAVAIDSTNVYALLWLATAYYGDRQYEKAREYYEETYRLSELQNNVYVKGSVYYRFADFALNSFELDKAQKYALQSLEIFKLFGRQDCCLIYIQLARIEQVRGNWDKSEAYVNEALQIVNEFESAKMSEEKKRCYLILYALSVAQRKYRQSTHYWSEIALVEKEIAQEATLRAAEEMAAKYETAKKELQIEQQHQVIAYQNTQRWFFLSGIAVCVVILALLGYMLLLRNRRNLALLERNDALAQMNATKDKFFSIISHDLKNPAIAQRDSLQLLIQNGRLWDTDKLTTYYHELLKSAEGQVELLYNLLGWAQVQTGRMAYTPDTFILNDLLSDLGLIRKMAQNKGVTLNVQIAPHTLVTADSNMLTIIIRNLLTNAIKFTGSGGNVTLDISHGRDGARPVSTVTIRDTGIGMTPEQIQNLFRIDRQQSTRGTAGEEGTGLGLIVCKELLEKHQSVLHVESQKEKGSTFWFELN
ncbi:MAG: ATP-binding protein [Bacteroidales bacterium]|nr:ATP-binding protein [Bacteroidales bacterium]